MMRRKRRDYQSKDDQLLDEQSKDAQSEREAHGGLGRPCQAGNVVWGSLKRNVGRANQEMGERGKEWQEGADQWA